MSNKILIVFAHPRFEKSKTNRALLTGAQSIDGVTLHDLYEAYPDFIIDKGREQRLLSDHDGIIWHFPLYTYSAPALLKQWMDEVLEHGWAHGSEGFALQEKTCLVALTAGGSRESYTRTGLNHFAIRELLAPFEQTARLCAMIYLPPFVVHATHLLTPKQLSDCATGYARVLTGLTTGQVNSAGTASCEYLNDWFDAKDKRVTP